MGTSEDAKNIHSGHRRRVKENALKNGLTQLEDHKLLELLLFYSIPREDTNETAHNLLKAFGSLGGVLKATKNELIKIGGVGENTALMLLATGEMLLRSQKEPGVKKRVYKTADDFSMLATSYFIGEKNEKLVLFLFDSGMRLKNTVLIAEGSAVSASIDFRKFLEAVINNSAFAAVISHNHPESDEHPSAADVDSTRVLAVMLRKIGVMLADHIVVGSDGKAYSMHSDERFCQMFY